MSWEINRGWMLSANLVSDLDAWVRLLALHDIDDLAVRHHVLPPRPPARPPHHPRPRPMAADRCHLALGHGVHHLLAATYQPLGHHLAAGHSPDEEQDGGGQQHIGLVVPGTPGASRHGPPQQHEQTAEPISDRTPLQNRGPSQFQPGKESMSTRLRAAVS
ncbi:hypothetical protein AB0M39_25555 [Streptomyces sp. NPDC051907]|uniref:hypothetical protein n=1 Tax=Streptomyces sp. NPDC051907 TaxID=3155284 RepID=UPI0034479F0D